MTSAYIKGRFIYIATDGGSTTVYTRNELEKAIADLAMRIETKIKSPKALERAKEALSISARALATAKANGL